MTAYRIEFLERKNGRAELCHYLNMAAPNLDTIKVCARHQLNGLIDQGEPSSLFRIIEFGKISYDSAGEGRPLII